MSTEELSGGFCKERSKRKCNILALFTIKKLKIVQNKRKVNLRCMAQEFVCLFVCSFVLPFVLFCFALFSLFIFFNFVLFYFLFCFLT